MTTETEDLRIIRLNPSNYSVEYLYDGFKKLVDNTGITVGCKNKKLSAGTRLCRRMEFQIKKIPKWRRFTFTNVGKTLKREQILSSLYRFMLKNVKFFVVIQDWLKEYKFRTTQDLIILSSLTTLWNCYYDLFTENMSTEYSRKSNWKKIISSRD